MTEEQYEPQGDYAARETYRDFASRWKRLGGALIDGLISLAVMIPVMYFMGFFDLFGEMVRDNRQTMPLGLTVQLVVISWVVFFAVHGYLLYQYGQTVGKRLVGTRMVDEDGNVPSFGKVVIMRYIVPGVITNLPIIGGIFGLVNVLLIFRSNHRCLHDDFAGTYVVNV